ncbi:MAG: PaaI family thioesterase [Paludibacterium sp.]|uniref:PaaI family thioesterase n=1 Tax=Paludibacterium sp. TaxID=1917523 RepID=UPI0025E79DD2|nr:PaaI family thioesterase [Paludibacterium sp.]MBV8049144.1 PaaI family thioesterase [Paludibacterium sp.]MBV8646982.1 PaaI family thioesterase [Paludibacterium sp.]
MEPHNPSLQELASPAGTCFGCGCAHPSGLHIQSYWDEDGKHVVSKYTPRPEFIGWPGLVYGGFLAMLVDCHSNWTVMAHHYRAEGREPGSLPKIECVTGDLNISYKKPTPMGGELTLKAWVEGEVGRKTRVICQIWAGDTLTVEADSVFVKVDAAALRHAAQVS